MQTTSRTFELGLPIPYSTIIIVSLRVFQGIDYIYWDALIEILDCVHGKFVDIYNKLLTVEGDEKLVIAVVGVYHAVNRNEGFALYSFNKPLARLNMARGKWCKWFAVDSLYTTQDKAAISFTIELNKASSIL